MSFLSYIARLIRDATAHNTINVRTAEIYFQKSPGNSTGDTRGIEGLTYRVMSGGVEIQSGTTTDDGLISVSIRGNDPSIVEILHNGQVMSQYQVRLRDDALEADTTLIGVQRRLRQLGYQLGSAGATNDGVDGQMGVRTDRAIQQFQADQGRDFDSVVGGQTRSDLNDEFGGSAQP